MIRAALDNAADGLARRLAAKAAALARASAERTLRARRGDTARWRKAGLLWPLFTKGTK